MTNGKSGGTLAGQTPVIISGGITKAPVTLEFSDQFRESSIPGEILYSLEDQIITRIEVFTVDGDGNETLLLKLDSDGLSNNPLIKIYYSAV